MSDAKEYRVSYTDKNGQTRNQSTTDASLFESILRNIRDAGGTNLQVSRPNLSEGVQVLTE